jgi:hypothetical protein
MGLGPARVEVVAAAEPAVAYLVVRVGLKGRFVLRSFRYTSWDCWSRVTRGDWQVPV